jgi:hypothetical protein
VARDCLKLYQALVDLGEYQTNEIEEKRKQLLKVLLPFFISFFLFFFLKLKRDTHALLVSYIFSLTSTSAHENTCLLLPIIYILKSVRIQMLSKSFSTVPNVEKKSPETSSFVPFVEPRFLRTWSPLLRLKFKRTE